MSSPGSFSAFVEGGRIASGSKPFIIAALCESGIDPRLALVFDDGTGDIVSLSSATEIDNVPKSGTPIALSIQILPRHQEWLDAQPGGPSAAIRRLIEAARRDPVARVGQSKAASYRFISMLAGDFEGYEEACRALFAGDAEHFGAATATWPPDIRNYGRDLAKPAFNQADEHHARDR